MSLRGAKRRGNLGKAVTILPGLSCDPAGYCEIATAPSGPRNDKSLAFTVLTKACTGCKCSAGRGMPLPSAKRQSDGQFGAMHRSRSHAPLICHCEERSDVAISGRQLRFCRGFPVIRPGTARLPRPLRGLAMTRQGGAAVHQRPYAVELSRTRRSLTAATDAIGTYHFNGSRYGLQVPSRDCHGRKAPSQ